MIVVRLCYTLVVSTLLLVTQGRHIRDPPCGFNLQCTCSKPGPDFGIVTCTDVLLPRVPPDINNTQLYELHLERNGMRELDPKPFYGTRMYRLTIRGNLLTTIPRRAFFGLEQFLWKLDLGANQIHRIPNRALESLAVLQDLDLSGNSIYDIIEGDFRGLESSLKTLILAENSLTILQPGVFKGLQNLETLDLRENNILYLPADIFSSSLQRLSHVLLGGNMLQQVPFHAMASLRNLRTLDLSGNLIAQTLNVTFTGRLSLETLRLDRNLMEHLPPNAFQHFGTLNCTYLDENPLFTVEEKAFKDARIRDLFMRNCEITEIDPMAFRGLEESLHLLDLSENNITQFPNKILYDFDFLKFLSLRENKATIAPKESLNRLQYTLYKLDITGDQMGFLPLEALQQMRSLRYLGISRLLDNHLGPEHFTDFGPALEELHVSCSNLQSLRDHAFQNVQGIKKLDLSDNDISQIQSMAFADVSLQELRLTHGITMSSIPAQTFKHLTDVQIVDMSNNKLRNIEQGSFNAMRKLKMLNLRDNQIGSIAPEMFSPKKHSHLEEIHLSFNNLQRIDSSTFADLKSLEDLYLDDNKIQAIDSEAFTNLNNLKHLNLEGNNIRDISIEAFRNLPNMEVLQLAHNNLKHIDLNSFERIGSLSTFNLNVSHNGIEALGFKQNGKISYSNIKILDFSHNNISRIEPAFFNAVRSQLIELYLGSNMIQNATRDIFGNIPYLQLLDLSHNEISELGYDTFRNSKRIQHLKLCHNAIVDLPTNLFWSHNRLRILDLSHNNIRELPDGLLRDTTLEFLDVSHNKLNRIPTSSLGSAAGYVRELNLSWNNIVTLSPDILSWMHDLVWLDLSSNRLTRLEDNTFSALPRLTGLLLGNNPIQVLRGRVFQGLHDSLHTLDIANTSLSAFPDLPLSSLIKLNISGNKIATISPKVTLNLTQLRDLDLSENKLSSSPEHALYSLRYLRSLFINGNPIRSITSNSFRGLDRLEELDLRQLPLRTFQDDSLHSLTSLRTLHVSTYEEIKNFNISRLLQRSTGIRSLHVLVEKETFGEELDGRLPYKLTNITITGRALQSLDAHFLQGLQGLELHLTIRNTSLETLDGRVLKRLGRVRNLTLDIRDNHLKTLSNPCSGDHPGIPQTVFLTGLQLSGNPWNCDCEIGWVEVWDRKRRQYLCNRVDDEPDSECLSGNFLRAATCVNKNNQSLLAVLKNDIECGWSSAAIASPKTITIFTAVAILFVQH